MNLINIYKALANETRSQIMEWLKKPRDHFSFGVCATEEKGVDMEETGVCVGLIQQKAGLSQSTTSHYLSLLEDAGLVQSKRIGQWTYYKRNEKTLKELKNYLMKNL